MKLVSEELLFDYSVIKEKAMGGMFLGIANSIRQVRDKLSKNMF